MTVRVYWARVVGTVTLNSGGWEGASSAPYEERSFVFSASGISAWKPRSRWTYVTIRSLMMSWAVRVMASWAVKKRVAALAIVYLMAVQASLCWASQLVVSLMTRRATARESVWRDSSLVVGLVRLKSGLGAVEGGGRRLVRCGLELMGRGQVDGGGERAGWGC